MEETFPCSEPGTSHFLADMPMEILKEPLFEFVPVQAIKEECEEIQEEPLSEFVPVQAIKEECEEIQMVPLVEFVAIWVNEDEGEDDYRDAFHLSTSKGESCDGEHEYRLLGYAVVNKEEITIEEYSQMLRQGLDDTPDASSDEEDKLMDAETKHENSNTRTTRSDRLRNAVLKPIKKRNLERYICATCNKTYTRKYLHSFHMNVKSGKVRHKCESCGWSLLKHDFTPDRLRKPVLKPIKKMSLERYICATCNKTYTTNYLHSFHMKVKSGKVRHKCESCDWSLLKQDFTPSKNFYSTRSELQPNKCNICNISFKSKECLSKHMVSTHTGCKVKKYVHKLTHVELKPYNCYICDKNFSEEAIFTHHMKLHSMHSKPTYTCNICSKSFTLKDHVTQHMQIHLTHAESLYKCDICNKSFTEKDHLTQHTFKHTGLSSLKCDSCGKSFTQKQALATHKVVHCEGKPHTCGVCGDSFRFKSGLTSHMLIHL